MRGRTVRDGVPHTLRRRQTRWLYSKAQVTLDEQGRPLRMLGITADVTERKLAELARRASDIRFENIFSSAAIGITLVDSNGRFLRANRTYCELLGYSEDELRRLSHVDITYPDDLAKTLENKRKLLAGEVSSFIQEKRYIRSDRRIVWVRNSVSAFPMSDTGSMALIAISEDITDRKAAEQSLSESEARYRMVVERATDIICRTDACGRVVFCNRAASQFLELADDVPCGMHFLEFVRPDWRRRVRRLYDLQFMRRSSSSYFEIPIVSVTGRERWIGVSVQLIFDGSDVSGFRRLRVTLPIAWRSTRS